MVNNQGEAFRFASNCSIFFRLDRAEIRRSKYRNKIVFDLALQRPQ